MRGGGRPGVQGVLSEPRAADQHASIDELLPKQSAGGGDGFITPDMGGEMRTMSTRCYGLLCCIPR